MLRSQAFEQPCINRRSECHRDVLDESLLAGMSLQIQWVDSEFQGASEMKLLAVNPVISKIVSCLRCKNYRKCSKALWIAADKCMDAQTAIVSGVQR
jgi:hypothetical protein